MGSHPQVNPLTTPSTGSLGAAAKGAPDPDRAAELADIGRLWRRGLRATVRAARHDERLTARDVIGEHLGEQAALGAVTEETWAGYEEVNVQVALDAWLSQDGRTFAAYGLYGDWQGCELADLVGSDPAATSVRLGNVSRRNVPSGPHSSIACVSAGLYLVHDPTGPIVVLKREAAPMYGRPRTSVQVLASAPGAAAATVRRLRELSDERNVFRGQVLSFGGDFFGGGESVLHFHTRPRLGQDALILPPEVLVAIEQQVIGVAEHRERLVAAGQHLKRGLLLYGPPGAGKTHTIRYLTSVMPHMTFIIVSGEALSAIDQACSIARTLQPAVVVVEDVDLIAEDRLSVGTNSLLFQLLNEMDGVGGDVDVAFILTTNRADVLEPALAQRPGRIDAAVEIGLPDALRRQQLFDLYRGQLQIEAEPEQIAAAMARTQGVTAAFLKEWLRRTALIAAQREARAEPGTKATHSAPLVATAQDLAGALDELLATRARLTRVLLGGEAPAQQVDDWAEDLESGDLDDV